MTPPWRDRSTHLTLLTGLLLAAALSACRPTTGGGPTARPTQGDPADPAPAEVARLALAADRGLAAADITIISTGAWTADAEPCDLVLPTARVATQLVGERLPVHLEAAGQVYEYWVFADVGGAMVAFGCEAAEGG